jgi:hypothetical protein
MRFSRSVVVSSLVAVLLAACGGAGQAPVAGDSGNVNFSVHANALVLGAADQALMPQKAYVRVYGTTARGAAVDTWYPLVPTSTGTGTTWQLSLNRQPVGTYQFHGVAMLDPQAAALDPADYATPLPDAAAQTLGAGGTLSVTLMLQQVAPPQTVNNHAPTVNSVTASAYAVNSTAGMTDVVALRASASDLDGDALSYLWSDNLLGGLFSADTTTSTSWTPPAGYAGPASITFTATDHPLAGTGGASSAVTLSLDVSPNNAKGSIVTVVDVNTWPIIDGMGATNAQVEPGLSTNVWAFTRDPDGDLLSYVWTDECVVGAVTARGTIDLAAGTVDPALGGAQILYTPAPGASSCRLTFSVSDGRGGRNTGTFFINVLAAPNAYAPEFVAAQMAPSAPVAGGNVSFFAAATQWNGTAYLSVTSYSWTASVAGGAFAAPATGSSVTYTAPACTSLAPGVNAITVTATALGTGGLTSTFSFPFSITCP